jgi:ABC-type antimicrobial peptide transport system permease subunit
MASYSVAKRMQEHGLRMALGAQRLEVMRSTWHRPVLLLLCGSSAGMVGGLLTSRFLAHRISFATASDPVVMLAVLRLMIFLGLLGGWIPARRALAIDPSRLLRE